MGGLRQRSDPRAAAALRDCNRDGVGASSAHGHRRLHPHRQQRLDPFGDIAAVHAELRPQPRGHAEGRAVRPRLRPLDDQAARLRRADGILGLCAGELHVDGGPRRRHRSHPALRVGPGAGDPAAVRRPHGRDDRLDQPRPLRAQHRFRLAEGRIRPDEHLARRAAFPAPLRLLRRVRHRHAGVVGNGAVGLHRQVLHHERLPPVAQTDREDRHHLRRPEPGRRRLRRRPRRLQLLFRHGSQRADQVPALGATQRGRGGEDRA